MEYAKIPLTKIKIIPRQSRKYFDQERIKQLAGSIKEVGQLQPVIVKKEGEDYLLIAGERRYRAIKENNGSKEIAAVILGEEDLGKASLKQIQLIENLQRQDLNPLERARAIQEFIEENGLTKKDVSRKLGIPRTTLTEWLNILEVDVRYQEAVLDEESPLSLSHITLARALANRTGDPFKMRDLLEGILKYDLSRRETKEIIDLFHKYLHMSMEEAISAILIKREREKDVTRLKKEKKGKLNHPVKKLLESLNRTGQTLEEIMAEVGELKEKEREDVIDEFLYIYQLMEIMIPEFKNDSIGELIDRIKEGK